MLQNSFSANMVSRCPSNRFLDAFATWRPPEGHTRRIQRDILTKILTWSYKSFVQHRKSNSKVNRKVNNKRYIHQFNSNQARPFHDKLTQFGTAKCSSSFRMRLSNRHKGGMLTSEGIEPKGLSGNHISVCLFPNKLVHG